jgi:hypothetical protein
LNVYIFLMVYFKNICLILTVIFLKFVIFLTVIYIFLNLCLILAVIFSKFLKPNAEREKKKKMLREKK